jgi:hypothetical protein
MAKLGPYSYPDIRFGDSVEIAGRILTKFKGAVSVKGLAWELGMAEGSGTLFAKVAALRDFGLVDGRGELHVTSLAQRVLFPTGEVEGRQARAEAFQRVELLRLLYERFQGEVPDDSSLLIGLEEITHAARDEIVRRASLIQKHLTDAVRILSRDIHHTRNAEHSAPLQRHSLKYLNNTANIPNSAKQTQAQIADGLTVSAGDLQLAVPLTAQYLDIAIRLLTTMRNQMAQVNEPSTHSETKTVTDAIAYPNAVEADKVDVRVELG